MSGSRHDTRYHDSDDTQGAMWKQHYGSKAENVGMVIATNRTHPSYYTSTHTIASVHLLIQNQAWRIWALWSSWRSLLCWNPPGWRRQRSRHSTQTPALNRSSYFSEPWRCRWYTRHLRTRQRTWQDNLLCTAWHHRNQTAQREVTEIRQDNLLRTMWHHINLTGQPALYNMTSQTTCSIQCDITDNLLHTTWHHRNLKGQPSQYNMTSQKPDSTVFSVQCDITGTFSGQPAPYNVTSKKPDRTTCSPQCDVKPQKNVHNTLSESHWHITSLVEHNSICLCCSQKLLIDNRKTISIKWDIPSDELAVKEIKYICKINLINQSKENQASNFLLLNTVNVKWHILEPPSVSSGSVTQQMKTSAVYVT